MSLASALLVAVILSAGGKGRLAKRKKSISSFHVCPQPALAVSHQALQACQCNVKTSSQNGSSENYVQNLASICRCSLPARTDLAYWGQCACLRDRNLLAPPVIWASHMLEEFPLWKVKLGYFIITVVLLFLQHLCWGEKRRKYSTLLLTPQVLIRTFWVFKNKD